MLEGGAIIDLRRVTALRKIPGIPGGTKGKDHTTHFLISLGPVTYPFWASVSSPIMRTETSPVIYNCGEQSPFFEGNSEAQVKHMEAKH